MTELFATSIETQKTMAGKVAKEVASYDIVLVWSVLCLMFIGLIMVASSSMELADLKKNNPFYFFNRQCLFLGMGVILIILVKKVDMQVWYKSGGILYFFGLFLLVLILMPGMSKLINGSHRWLSLGIFNLQVSELIKLFAVIYLSGYICRHGEAICCSCMGVIRPFILILLASGLLLMEPDFGATAVMLATVLGMMFLAGAKIKQFMIFILVAACLLASLVIFEPYRLIRWMAFLHPFDESVAQGSAYQLIQSLIAFARGDWWGVNVGEGVQKLFYLPEAHTDFLLAIMAEEMGVMAVITVLTAYSLILYRSFSLGWKSELLGLRFNAYMAYGIGILLTLEAFINMGVNMGLLPTKGLTLPFMSYGGSSMLVSCIAIGFLLRIYDELYLINKKTKRESV